MESLWPLGYISFAAFFYAFSMRNAPVMNHMEDELAPLQLSSAEIIELFPAVAEERKAA